MQHPQAVDRLPRSLPGWFGIEASNAAYVESARHLPTYLARPASAAGSPAGRAALPVGVLLGRRHFAQSADPCLIMAKSLSQAAGPSADSGGMAFARTTSE